MKLGKLTKSAALLILASSIIATGDIKAFPAEGYRKDSTVLMIESLSKKKDVTYKQFVEALGEIDATGVVFHGTDILVTSKKYNSKFGWQSYDAIVLIRAENQAVAKAIQAAFEGEFKSTIDGGEYLVVG